jgi:hypothetical protein
MKLTIEDLTVSSFSPDPSESARAGTVHGQQLSVDLECEETIDYCPTENVECGGGGGGGGGGDTSTCGDTNDSFCTVDGYGCTGTIECESP